MGSGSILRVGLVAEVSLANLGAKPGTAKSPGQAKALGFTLAGSLGFALAVVHVSSDAILTDRDEKATVEAFVRMLAGVSNGADSIEPGFESDDGLILCAEQNLPSRETVDALWADRVQGNSEIDEVFPGHADTAAFAAAFRAARRLPRSVRGAGLCSTLEFLRVRVTAMPVPRRAVASVILIGYRSFRGHR